MSLRSPLSIRVSDGTADRHVTQDCTGLKFTKVANGGHQVCSFSMTVPHDEFPDLGPQDRCWVYDKRTGATVFGAAYMENPTPVDGPSGQSFDVQAYGGMALANDETRGLAYIDQTTLGDYAKSTPSPTSSDVQTGMWASPEVRVQFPNGMVVDTGYIVAGESTTLQRANMSLGAFRVYVYSGKTDTGYRTMAYTSNDAMLIGDGAAMNQAGITDVRWAGIDFSSATSGYISFSLQRVNGATNIADDQTWTGFVDIALLGQRCNRYGTLLTGEAGLVSATSLLASQVVEDLLGRLLRFCDPVTAVVASTTFPIRQLVYPDGAKAATVLNDLGDYEPNTRWGIGADNPVTGLHDFWYAMWDDQNPRYLISVKDGFRQSGSDSDLCNRIAVSWTDSDGNPQVTVVTAASLGLVGIGLPVDALGDRIKDADPIALPDGHGSAANAQQVGAGILRDKINPPLAGTAVVRRPILDQVTGNTVMPWELEPGCTVLVREPGYTIRCTQVDYDDDSVSATLTLGRPQLTESQRIARLS